ncbi:MAG: hypothetical protein E7588_00005 [Ruminococcaceae bacterium]|nr:hypothetical protein [Oscillospiraceae bacterium]
MKKTFLFVLTALMIFCVVSCAEDKPVTPDVTVPVENDLPDASHETDILPAEDNEKHEDDEPPIELTQKKSYANTINNNLNGATVLYADDFYIYDTFIEVPDDEYMGGEHRVYRAWLPGVDGHEEYVSEEIYAPYFAARNMCIYDNKLYFTTGGGGGRHLVELDLDTLESKNLHDNLTPDFGYFIDFLQLVDDKLYFECNGSIYRMKTDQTEFEVLKDGENDFSSYMLGVVDNYLFYFIHNDYELRRIDLQTKQDTLVLDNYSHDFVNFYGGRIYYNNGRKLMSSDADGVEIRTVFELEENESFRAINISDGYVYYTVAELSESSFQNSFQKETQHVVYEYNLNGGEKRHIYTGDNLYQLIVQNGYLFFYELHPYAVSGQFKCIDPVNLQEIPVWNGTALR